MKEWKGFKKGKWMDEIDVRDFIQKNYAPYEGDESFLTGPTDRTIKLWNKVLDLMKEEREKGILDVETKKVSTITSHGPGYIDKELEQIVGVQTDKPLKRGIIPFGGLRVVRKALKAYNYELDSQTEDIFLNYRKTHNDGVFDAYTDDMKKARNSGIITGLPDAYGRGRIIGDYRRVALYGIDKLIEEKNDEKKQLEMEYMESQVVRLREEITEQIRALHELKEMAKSYGSDISRPAYNGKEAVQWTYFGYLGAIKEQDGAAMSLGRVSTFLDIYFERDFKNGVLTERLSVLVGCFGAIKPLLLFFE